MNSKQKKVNQLINENENKKYYESMIWVESK